MSTETKYDVFISYSRKDYVDEATKQVIPGNIVICKGESSWHEDKNCHFT